MKPLVAISASVLLAATGVGLLTQHPHRPPSTSMASAAPRATPSARPAQATSPGTPVRASASSAPAASTRTPTASASAAAPSPEPAVLAPGDGPGADATVQKMLDQASPQNVPAAQARSLEDLGRQVWLADITGIGRSRWPQYFTTAGSSGYTAVRVQAAIARAGGPGKATVTLLWAGTSPAGDPEVALPGTVHLIRQSNGTWNPTP